MKKESMAITSAIFAPAKSDWACQIVNWLYDYEMENGHGIKKEHVKPEDIWLNGIYALDGDKLIGGATFNIENDWMFILKAFILPEYRGLKIYSEIIRRLEDTARKCSLSGVWVSTYTFEAPHIYEHLGFTKGNVLPNMPRGNTSIDYYKVFN